MVHGKYSGVILTGTSGPLMVLLSAIAPQVCPWDWASSAFGQVAIVPKCTSNTPQKTLTAIQETVRLQTAVYCPDTQKQEHYNRRKTNRLIPVHQTNIPTRLKPYVTVEFKDVLFYREIRSLKTPEKRIIQELKLKVKRMLKTTFLQQ